MHRIGIGYDIHRLKKGRPLWLGGVHIPFGKGLSGHSDADALLHAIIDALLGAAALPDIGHYFPPSDPQIKNIASRVMLQKALSEVGRLGYQIEMWIRWSSPKPQRSLPTAKPCAKILRDFWGYPSSRCRLKERRTKGWTR